MEEQPSSPDTPRHAPAVPALDWVFIIYPSFRARPAHRYLVARSTYIAARSRARQEHRSSLTSPRAYEERPAGLNSVLCDHITVLDRPGNWPSRCDPHLMRRETRCTHNSIRLHLLAIHPRTQIWRGTRAGYRDPCSSEHAAQDAPMDESVRKLRCRRFATYRTLSEQEYSRAASGYSSRASYTSRDHVLKTGSNIQIRLEFSHRLVAAQPNFECLASRPHMPQHSSRLLLRRVLGGHLHCDKQLDRFAQPRRAFVCTGSHSLETTTRRTLSAQLATSSQYSHRGGVQRSARAPNDPLLR